VNELANWGARFHREKDGRLTQRFFGAHTYRRTVFYEDWTGEEIIRVLMDQVSQRKIKIIDNVYVTKLLKSDDVIEEEPAAGGKEEGEGEELKVPLADLFEAHLKPEHHREFE
jgi:aspartate oxidase